MSNNEKQTTERDSIGLIPVLSAVALIVFSCSFSQMQSPWGYVLLIPAIPFSVYLGWAIATKGGRE